MVPEDVRNHGDGEVSDRVRPRPAFAPERALDEVHRVGCAHAHVRVPLHPQEHAVGITDDDQVPRLVRRGGQAGADQRRHRRERMHLPAGGGLVRIGDRRDPQPGRVDAGCRRAPPRRDDRLAHRLAVPANGNLLPVAFDESLPRASELSRPVGRSVGHIDGQPRVRHASASLRHRAGSTEHSNPLDQLCSQLPTVGLRALSIGRLVA
jgi:hypothetical protein